ncbi:MAG: serine O-acetyltransferase EpsC [Kiritimatiellia bacterium]
MTLPQRIARIIRHGMAALHPCVYGELGVKGAVEGLAADLEKEVALLCPDRSAREIVAVFMARLPEVRRLVETDITAAYEGDPAASSRMEVVMAYPGLYAVTIHRLAHELYKLAVPVIPRVMAEIAHSKTGIDIHPGATIGERFFIDHGTGVVIGETCVIGTNVKLYQGVTLGAKSFARDPNTGVLVKGIKRHPNVEDNVVIYAGATILGGDTTIGHDSEIGGSVWLISSVPPNSRVYNKPPAPVIKAIG